MEAQSRQDQTSEQRQEPKKGAPHPLALESAQRGHDGVGPGMLALGSQFLAKLTEKKRKMATCSALHFFYCSLVCFIIYSSRLIFFISVDK